ncbi:hypothetical protein BJY52DRAFT_1242445 [Lactarius psammicola]|nr:hypothetical protein BJY52DRAFT_1242445 [Lactarius psammicola]
MGAIVKRSVPSLYKIYIYISISASIPPLELLETSLVSDWVLLSLFDVMLAMALALVLAPVPTLVFLKRAVRRKPREKP